jgi:hypothetical protein
MRRSRRTEEVQQNQVRVGIRNTLAGLGLRSTELQGLASLGYVTIDVTNFAGELEVPLRLDDSLSVDVRPIHTPLVFSALFGQSQE